jgi:hypothetical protein
MLPAGPVGALRVDERSDDDDKQRQLADRISLPFFFKANR